MTLDDAQKHIGGLVRIAPQAERGRDGAQHWGRGKLVAVGRRTVTVEPFGRRGTGIDVDPKHLHVWHAHDRIAAAEQNPHPEEQSVTAPPAVPIKRVDVAAQVVPQPSDPLPGLPPAPPRTSDVLSLLTTLVAQLREDEQRLRSAESRHAEAVALARDAEAEVLSAMEAIELRKSEARRLRGQLDALLGDAN